MRRTVIMNYRQYYEENKPEILRILYDLDYSPHSLVSEASKENMSVYEYIYILCNI